MTRRVLLLMENYKEMAQLEGVLRRIGIDVLGLQKTHALSEMLLTFSPDVVVLPSSGTRINGVELNKKIKRRRGMPKVVFLVPAGSRETFANVDGVFELPFEPHRFVTMLGQLLSIDVATMQEKLHKLLNRETATAKPQAGLAKESRVRGPLIHVKDAKARSNRYRQITQDLNAPTDATLDRAQVHAYIQREKDIPIPSEEELDKAKQEFVRALFSMPPKKTAG